MATSTSWVRVYLGLDEAMHQIEDRAHDIDDWATYSKIWEVMDFIWRYNLKDKDREVLKKEGFDISSWD